MSSRDEVRRLAQGSISRGDAAGWFEELGAFTGQGLTEVSVTDFPDHETPPVRRFRARFERR